ncbi:outer envelope protein 64, mitochondrial [Nymphaea colorata]|nr:outer envelope protein 64, mitochondrial [Nymphaea colorata]
MRMYIFENCRSPVALREDSLETAKLDTSSSLSLSKLHVSSAKVWIIVGLGVAGIILLSRRRLKSTARLKDLGAFIDRFVLLPSPQPPPPAARLPLTDLVFAVKDVFDVKGYVTGFGNPDWKATHEPATRTAAAVSSLLKQGAACAGKTMLDEFALGFTGENKHYGTPMNPEEPSQIPGGSSSGSAVAVAGELVDFALGTDTVGCVRIPAACCGILGFRPSHGSVPTAGVLQNSPSLDTIGWLAKDPSVLREVGHVLLQLAPGNLRRSRRFIFADDCFQLSTVPKQKSVCVIEKATEKLSGYQPPKHINLGQYIASAVPSLRGFHEPSVTVQQGTSTLRVLSYVMALLQRYEFRVNYEEWFNKMKPSLGPDVSAQVHSAMNSTEENIKSCYKVKSEMRSALNGLLKDDGILVVPTIPEPPPRVNSKKSSYNQFQNRASVLMSLATLSGCCQVSIPLGKHDGSSISVSLIASYGGDKFLLDTVLDMYSSLREAADAASNLPPVPDTDGDMDTAELFKEKGNAAFKGRQWNKAVKFYTEAIKLNRTTATYYSNRAAAYLELGCFQQAESDCNEAILLDKKNVKAYLRRGTAKEMLYFYRDANEDFKHALVLEPQNKAALSATKRLKKLME